MNIQDEFTKIEYGYSAGCSHCGEKNPELIKEIVIDTCIYHEGAKKNVHTGYNNIILCKQCRIKLVKLLIESIQ